MRGSELSTSVVKCSEGLNNRVYILLEYIYRSNEVRCLCGCFFHHIFYIFFWFYLVSLYIWFMFCTLLSNFVNYINYVFLLLCLCILIAMYAPFWVFCFMVLFCVLFLCKCVMYYCHRVSTQLQLTNTPYNHH